MKLYKYTGTISEVSFRNSTNCAIKLYDMNDRDKAPTRLEVVGALGKYIWDIEGTDAEERYIPNDFYFDDNLYLWRIRQRSGLFHHLRSGSQSRVLQPRIPRGESQRCPR